MAIAFGSSGREKSGADVWLDRGEDVTVDVVEKVDPEKQAERGRARPDWLVIRSGSSNCRLHGTTALLVNHKPWRNRPAFERALRFFGLASPGLIYRVTATGRGTLARGRLSPAAESHHLGGCDRALARLSRGRFASSSMKEFIEIGSCIRSCARVGCIPITSRKAKDAMREAAARIRAGEIVCLFPEGELSRSGSLLRLRRGYEIIARQAEAPVVPVWLDRLWGSIFSFQGGRFFTKWPKAIPYRVTVAFGQPLPADDADIATVREELLKIGEFCYSQRPVLRGHLARACLRGLKRQSVSNRDHRWTRWQRACRAANCSASRLALSRHLRKQLSRAADWNRPAARQRRRGRESRGDPRGQNSGESELHQSARLDRIRQGTGGAQDDHHRARDGETAGRFSLDAGRDSSRRSAAADEAIDSGLVDPGDHAAVASCWREC